MRGLVCGPRVPSWWVWCLGGWDQGLVCAQKKKGDKKKIPIPCWLVVWVLCVSTWGLGPLERPAWVPLYVAWDVLDLVGLWGGAVGNWTPACVVRYRLVMVGLVVLAAGPPENKKVQSQKLGPCTRHPL